MDEDDIQDNIDRATTIGIENAQILQLTADWCRTHRGTRGPLGGEGLVELLGLV